MKLAIITAALLTATLASHTSAAQLPASCVDGAYGRGGNIVAIVSRPDAPRTAQRYLFLDGRRGFVADQDAPFVCAGQALVMRDAARWERIALTSTPTHFVSVVTQLTGQVLEPVGPSWNERPLVVMVHGSERDSALGSPYPWILAAQGIAVFVYDKRGTGTSGGDYTQNFELLAADAAAAMTHARSLLRGRFGRAGYFGGSQGGWVAPLAATLSGADFVAVGFGLVASPIEEDREEMLSEANALQLDAASRALLNRLSHATATLLRSGFVRGYDELAAVRTELLKQPWSKDIHGEYSGDMVQLSEADLRRYGRARFDNLQLIWDYDALAVLKRLDAPLLWVLAGEDREAPIGTTRAALTELLRAGRSVDVYLFPDTDHGMIEFLTQPDGSRKATRITEGYLRLLADWIKGATPGPYGRAQKLAR